MFFKRKCNALSLQVVASGGKEGLLGFSHGAEESAADDIARYLKDNGFIERIHEF